MKKKAFFLVILLCTGLLCTACTRAGTLAPQAAPAWSDLQYDHSMTLRYAQNFSVDYYEGGYALITIVQGGRFLVVPEGCPVPRATEQDITVLRRPVNNIYLVATSAMDLFCALDALDTISLSGTKAEGWYIAAAKEAMQAGSIAYAGKYNAPDYEKIVEQGCDLAIESTMIYHTPEVKEQLEQFHIPVLVERSSYESHPLGRAEWIRLYGVLLGKDAQARAMMDAQAAKLEQVTNETAADAAQNTAAFFYISGSGYANVRKSGDYVARMIALAGGRYVFDTLGGEGALSTVNLQMEEFYATAKNADVLIYNSAIDGELKTLDALLGKSPLLKNCKAVQTGNVWCTTQNMFQETMSLGDMIVDFHTVLTTPDAPDTLEYLYRLR